MKSRIVALAAVFAVSLIPAAHGQPQTTNIAFGGDDWKTLYFTSRSSLYMVNLQTPGIPVPVKKRSA